MTQKEKKRERPNLRFKESEIKLALSVIEKMEKPIELMYYLLEHENENPFVIIFISAKNIDLDYIINQQKRDTDILFHIDREENLFSIICQETKIDGAYRFAQRLVNTILKKEGHSVYCSEMEVRSSKYSIKEIIFRAIEIYIKAVKDKKEKEINFLSLS